MRRRHSPNQLPSPRTTLIGREHELDALRSLFSDSATRMVTIVGPGGVGKTRLAVEYARGAPEEVAFVQLSELQDAALVGPAIIDAVISDPEQVRVGVDEFLDSLRQRTILIVLDNLEQVVESAAFLPKMLDAGPGVAILATSRLPLRIEGEREFPLEPLPIGDPSGEPSGAVRLFVERATAVDPRFALTPANLEDVTAICQRLDGLPLALELAAARIKVLSPAAMRARLDQVPHNPGPGRRDAPPRQQTLANAIDWSYRLLNSEEQRLLRAISVFSGGFTIEAATAIWGNDEDGFDLFDGVATLVNHSLVRKLDAAGDDRFGMLQTIRSFGLEHLDASGDGAAVRARHAAHFTDFVERAGIVAPGAAQFDAVARVHVEIDNVRDALNQLAEVQDTNGLLRLTDLLRRYWLARGALAEARVWLERAIEHSESADPLLRLRAFNFASWVASFEGDHELALERGRIALRLAEELGDLKQQINVLNAHGGAALNRGDLPLAIALWEDAAARCELDPTITAFAGIVHNLGLAYLYRGDTIRARQMQARSLALAIESESLDVIHASHILQVQLEIAEGDARAAHEALLQFAGEIFPLEDDYLAIEVAYVTRDLALLFGAYESMRIKMGYALCQAEAAFAQDRVDAIRAALGEEAMARAMAQGALLTNERIAEMIRALQPERRPEPEPSFHGLTPREMDVLRLLGSGATNQEIADALFVSARTVQTHVANILTKLGAPSRAAAASIAAKQGLL